MFDLNKIHKKHIQNLKQQFKDEEILQVAAFASLLIAESIGENLYSNLVK